MDGNVLLWPLNNNSQQDNDPSQMQLLGSSVSSSSSSSSSFSSSSVSPLSVLSAHLSRCCRLCFHPSGLYLFSTSFDETFRLWDLTSQQSVYSQPGHSYPVYAVSCHPDGSLLLTGDLGGVGHIWDLRTGRSILSLCGHAKGLLCADWHPNGFILATGSADHTSKIWDMRGKQAIYTLPAHQHLISSIKWGTTRISTGTDTQRQTTNNTDFLITASYDCTVKLWDSYNFSLLQTLTGHEKLVMGVDMANQSTEALIASASYDRTWKLWNLEEALIEEDSLHSNQPT